MKWYKHLVDSGDDPDIRDSMTLFGEAGYYIFFRTLEVLSREFNIKNPGQSTFSLQYFSSRFYHTNWRTLSKVLQFFQDRDRFNIQFSENKNFKEITVKCLKLKDLCDEYTQKLLLQKSGQTPDSVGTNSRIEEEVRSKKKNIKERNIKKEPDPVWIETLKNKECYAHLNIDLELEKCLTYFETKNIKVSRQRFLNWLNRNPTPISKQDFYPIHQESKPLQILPEGFVHDPKGKEKIEEIIKSITQEKAIPPPNLKKEETRARLLQQGQNLIKEGL